LSLSRLRFGDSADTGQAGTMPAVRAEIVLSAELASLAAKRCGMSDETVRKWRKRGE